MRPRHADFRQPSARLRSTALAAAALVMLGAGATSASSAAAADVDLTVNVTSDRGSYAVDQPAVYTVRVDNRSDRATAAGATATLDVPNMQGSTTAWETSASGVRTGGGAAAPTGFARTGNGRSVTATLPSIPAGGWVAYSLTAPGNPANGVTGSLTVTATVAPASGDTDVDTATDTSTVGVVVKAVSADYATRITDYPTSGIADGATITADVAVINTGVRNSLRATQTLAGTLAGAQIVSARLLSGPGSSPTITPGTSVPLDVGGMPSGSTSVFRLTIAVGATCNVTGTPRTMTLTSAVGPAGGVAEATALNGDNTAVATFSVLTPACLQSDVRVDALEQTTPTAPAVLPHDGPFAFRAVYANTGPDTAPSSISFTLTWATGEGAPSMPADPVCVAGGGAVCPTSWNISRAATPGTPGLPSARGTSSVSATGSGAVVPVGGTLTITYTGTGGAADDLVCGDRPGGVTTSITPASSFTDAVPTNNFTNLSVSESIGVACGISHDFQLTVPWFRNDPSGTPLLQGTADFAPGDTAYFDITGVNASNPDQAGLGVAGTAPYVDLNGYSEISRFGSNVPPDFISGNQQFDLSDPGNVFWQSSTGALAVAAGTLSSPLLSSNPLNIACVSTTVIVCPDTAVRQNTLYPGVHPYPFLFDIGWADHTRTVLPAGSTMHLLAAYKVPDLPEQYRQAGCVPQGVLIGGSPTATSVLIPFYLISFLEQTTKASGEVGTVADRWRGVNIRVNYTRCTQDLAIAQTIVDAGGDPIASPTLSADRTVRYRVTITNPAGSAPLALPRFTESFSPRVASATATCDPALSTGGAVCPTGTFTAGTRYLADGSTAATGAADPQLDVTWGSAGAPTLPAGSSVTFLVEARFPADTATTATAIASAFDAAPGSPFPLVSDSDAVAPAASGALLSIRKSVTPVDPHPGDTVSFVVDLLNAGDAATPAYFSDPLHPDLVAANPDGFANVTCTAVTAAMGLLDGPLGTTPCPSFTSDATGIRGSIPAFAANSGLRITYTAVAPTTITSTPNIASIYADADLATAADRSAWANFLIRPLAATEPTEPTEPTDPELASTGADPAAAGWAVLAGVLMLGVGGTLVGIRRYRAPRRRSAAQ